MKSDLHVYVDVDGTIAKSIGAKLIAIPKVIQHAPDLKGRERFSRCDGKIPSEYLASLKI